MNFLAAFFPQQSETLPPYLFDQELETQLREAQVIVSQTKRIQLEKRLNELQTELLKPVSPNTTHSANQKFNPDLRHPNPRRGQSLSYCKLVEELNSSGSRSAHSHQ